MKKFWNFIRNDAGERVLRLEGPIDEDSFWGDEVTPQAFRDELEAEEGDVTVWICSPGGNVFAAAEIYTMLCDHKGNITVKIDSIAASAASVVAMAGDRVLMSPVAMLMIHDPMTIAMGNAADMEKAITTLNEVKESIINAYAKKSGLSRTKIAKLMSDETWMNARKAVELGFADEILFTEGKEAPEEGEKDDGEDIKTESGEWQPYSTRIMGQTILNRLGCGQEAPIETDDKAPSDALDVEAPETKRADSASQEPTEYEADTLAGDETSGEEPAGESDDSAGEKPPTDTPAEEPSGTVDQPQEESPEEDKPPETPVIGMDGKDRDGAMPFDLLMKQLDFLK